MFLLTSYQVQHMRRNLDQSEAAIIQVFEEKQRVWERQMDELRQNYASRLQQVILSVINFKVIETGDFLYRVTIVQEASGNVSLVIL